MKYNIRLNNAKFKTRKAIDILGCLLPFSDLANRERDVLAEYIDGYIRLKDKVTLTEDEIFTILFDYDFTLHISNELSTTEKPVSMDSVRNYTTKLRKKGLLSDKSINKDFLNLFSNIGDNITFVFEIKTN